MNLYIVEVITTVNIIKTDFVNRDIVFIGDTIEKAQTMKEHLLGEFGKLAKKHTEVSIRKVELNKFIGRIE